MADSPNGSVTAAPFRRHGLGYIYEPPDLGVRFLVDYLTTRQDELHAEIVVEDHDGGHLYQARLSLSGPNSKAAFVKHLAAMAAMTLPDTAESLAPWSRMVEDLCAAVVRAERKGPALHRVSGVRPVDARRYQVAPLVPEGLPTILYGPWANAKGWLAVGMAVAVAQGAPVAGHPVRQGNVLYLDWEDNEQTFDNRAWLVSTGLGLARPPDGLLYRACRGSLRRQIHQIAEEVSEHQVALLVVDSVGLAAGTPGDSQSYEDKALSMFEALRLVPCTQLLIDHVSGQGRRSEQVAGKAFGSEYKMAEAREAWEIRKDQALGASELRVACYHIKANHGPLLRPLGFRVRFEPDEVRIDAAAVSETGALADRMDDHERIRDALEHEGVLTTRAISELVYRTPSRANQVRTVISRHKDMFEPVPGTTPERWRNRAPGIEGDPISEEQIPF